MFKTVIWATDGSEEADAALQQAVELARLSEGRVVAVHCDHRLHGRAAAYPALANEEDVRIALRRQVEELEADGVDIELVIRRSHRDAADIVTSIAGELGGDVIVCGTRGFGPLTGAAIGSFTQKLLHTSPCPVLAVRGRAELESGNAKDEEKAAVA